MTDYEMTNGYVPDEKIKEYFQNEEELTTTDNQSEGLFLLRDGTMISGFDTYGVRSADHASAYGLTSEGEKMYGIHNSSDVEKVWPSIHEKTGMVRMVPETQSALIGDHQELTDEQIEVLASSDFEFELIEYCHTKEAVERPTEETQINKNAMQYQQYMQTQELDR